MIFQINEIESQEVRSVGLVRECTGADGDVEDTLQGEQKGCASSVTHYLTRQILPPYDMLIYIQSDLY